MSEELARRVTLKVTINGHDATDFVSPDLLDLSYTDQASDKADEVQITLHDRAAHWRNEWVPKKDMPVNVSIVCHDWFAQGDSIALPCGAFKIDEVEYKGPPATVAIKAVSASLTGKLRDTTKTRAWENKGLQDLAGEIASEHGLQLVYQGASNAMARIDQRNESDLAFLQRLAQDRGMGCKVHDGRLAVYDLEQAEGQSATLTVKPSGEGQPLTVLVPQSWTFKETSQDTGYDKASVSYADPKTGTTHKADVQRQGRTAGVPSQGTDKTLTIEQRAESAGDAVSLGKGAMQKKNKKESTCTLDFCGDPRLVAGITIQLDGFGHFGGKYMVKKATHKVAGSGGYTTSVELTRCGVTSGVWAVRVTDEALPSTPRFEAPKQVKIVLDTFKSAASVIETQRQQLESYASGFGSIWSAAKGAIDALQKPKPEPEPDDGADDNQGGNQGDAPDNAMQNGTDGGGHV